MQCWYAVGSRGGRRGRAGRAVGAGRGAAAGGSRRRRSTRGRRRRRERRAARPRVADDRLRAAVAAARAGGDRRGVRRGAARWRAPSSARRACAPTRSSTTTSASPATTARTTSRRSTASTTACSSSGCARSSSCRSCRGRWPPTLRDRVRVRRRHLACPPTGTRWGALCGELAAHLVERYGIDEVAALGLRGLERGEPRGVLDRHAARSTSASTRPRCGRSRPSTRACRSAVPATAAAGWIPDFLDFVRRARARRWTSSPRTLRQPAARRRASRCACAGMDGVEVCWTEWGVIADALRAGQRQRAQRRPSCCTG